MPPETVREISPDVYDSFRNELYNHCDYEFHRDFGDIYDIDDDFLKIIEKWDPDSVHLVRKLMSDCNVWFFPER